MNLYAKKFFLRGMLFGGFGPIVTGIVYLILSLVLDDFSLSGKDAFFGILSTYLLAFVHAGASVFNQIEHWPVAKSTLFHFGVLYPAYTACYLLNAWIPFDWRVLAIYTACFVIGYFVIWLSVFFCIRAAEKSLNKKIRG